MPAVVVHFKDCSAYAGVVCNAALPLPQQGSWGCSTAQPWKVRQSPMAMGA
jgi:hypothetical protein